MTFPLIKSRSHLGLVRFPSSHEPWQGDRRWWKQSPLWLLQSSSSKGKLILHRNLFCAVTCQPTISHRHPNKNPQEKISHQYHDGLHLSFSCKFNLLLFRNLDSSLPSFCLQITLSAPEQGLNFKASSQASWAERDPPRWEAETTRREKSSLTSFDGRGARQISTESL